MYNRLFARKITFSEFDSEKWFESTVQIRWRMYSKLLTCISLCPLRIKYALPVYASISMSAEIISLSLGQVSGQA